MDNSQKQEKMEKAKKVYKNIIDFKTKLGDYYAGKVDANKKAGRLYTQEAIINELKELGVNITITHYNNLKYIPEEDIEAEFIDWYIGNNMKNKETVSPECQKFIKIMGLSIENARGLADYFGMSFGEFVAPYNGEDKNKYVNKIVEGRPYLFNDFFREEQWMELINHFSSAYEYSYYLEKRENSYKEWLGNINAEEYKEELCSWEKMESREKSIIHVLEELRDFEIEKSMEVLKKALERDLFNFSTLYRTMEEKKSTEKKNFGFEDSLREVLRVKYQIQDLEVERIMANIDTDGEETIEDIINDLQEKKPYLFKRVD